MRTPIFDFVKKYSESGVERLHMPGHKGCHFTGCESLDITEIKGADALYEAKGIIAESERNASFLFGSKATFYSAEGSSQCIKAMLCLAKSKSKKKHFTVIAARNVHKSFVYACGLLDIHVRWLFDESKQFSLCRCKITPEQLEVAMKREKADAVYVTSPDYLGGMTDIAALSAVAHKYGALMLIDNAHGAYLRFLENSLHPIDMGADMCCDSAHKTLPVLTGGAYLHINNEKLIGNAKNTLEMFGSTSPSYLILQSLDLCNAYLADGYAKKLNECIGRIEKLKSRLREKGWKISESDPLKLTVLSSGIDLADRLRKSGIECEYEDPDYTVMMFTPETPCRVYDRVYEAAGKCDCQVSWNGLSMPNPQKCIEIREALFAENEAVSVQESVGRTVADTSVGCPPAVPVVISGETVTSDAVKIMKYYGIDRINVVK